jgi:hypothetical protein
MKKSMSDINIIKEKILKKDDRFSIAMQDNTVVATYLPYNLDFVYIPEGIYNKGLSPKERQQAKEINPNVFLQKMR